jgi:DnaK suppressor protein
MTNEELSRFRTILEATVMELDRSTRRRDAIVIEKSADELDQRIHAVEREFAVRSIEAGSIRLREARAALRRIREGTYGTCQECEEDISPRRLAALPTAALCIRCQEANDCRCAATNARSSFAMAA